MLFQLFLNTKSPEEIIAVVRAIAPTFGGINLEDIAAPNCFVVEEALQDLGIPVFHDDQHGTAIVVMASLINAAKVVKKNLSDMKVVINGSGAAGIAITKLLGCIGQDEKKCSPLKNLIICDSKGIVSSHREDLNEYKKQLLSFTNKNDVQGSLADALIDADCFIGVSKGNILTKQHIQSMSSDPIIFALANPVPEIMPDIAMEAGVRVIGTGRSDFPNQINNVLVFPGIFKGALEAKATRITPAMKIAAAYALSGMVSDPDENHLLPSIFDPNISEVIATAVKNNI
jgi:malate dehydrogenase (oxaloacetate-decarboxylating)